MDEESENPKNRFFPSTLFDELQKAKGSCSDTAAQALKDLYERYYKAIVKYFQNRLHDEAKALECAHDFISDRRMKKCFETWDPSTCKRFRAYLAGALYKYHIDFGIKSAKNRHLSLEDSDGVALPASRTVKDRSTALYGDDEAEGMMMPSEEGGQQFYEFDHGFAILTLREARKRLRREYEDRSKTHLFDLLSPFLFGEPEYSQKDVAEMFSPPKDESTISKELSKMRDSFARIFKELVAFGTDPGVVDDEVRALKYIASAEVPVGWWGEALARDGSNEL